MNRGASIFRLFLVACSVRSPPPESFRPIPEVRLSTGAMHMRRKSCHPNPEDPWCRLTNSPNSTTRPRTPTTTLENHTCSEPSTFIYRRVDSHQTPRRRITSRSGHRPHDQSARDLLRLEVGFRTSITQLDHGRAIAYTPRKPRKNATICLSTRGAATALHISVFARKTTRMAGGCCPRGGARKERGSRERSSHLHIFVSARKTTRMAGGCCPRGGARKERGSRERSSHFDVLYWPYTLRKIDRPRPG
jgi:hypothetical protein